MYHRVLTPEADQHVHRFLWRNLKIENKPDVYIKTVLTFGDKPAPAMALIALKKTAEEAETLFPKAAQVLKENTYMDDICASVTNIEEASKLTLDIDQVLAQGGFKVKGWTSNKMLFTATETESTELKLLESMSEEKVLGVVWNNIKDVFTFKVNNSLHKYTSVDTKTLESLTKRRILSQIAKIFDPIGLAAAFLIRMKIGMQKLWQMGLDWDESLPQSVYTEWTSLFTEMNELNCVEFERCLTPVESVGLPVLCIFSDASDEAFGASAYLRWKTDFGYAVRFVAAKSRVAPLKKLTIPRLELQAAVMSARLYKFILEEIRMNIEKTMFFVDSTIVLAWIQGYARKYKPFVSARIGEIQDITDSSQWLHIRSEDNVADDISRGISVQQLTKRWKHGPEFLYTEEENWPTDTIKPTEVETQLETRKIICVNAVTVKESIMDSNNFSSFNKLLRVTAYVRRFIYNLLGKIRNKDTCKEPLSAEEIVASENYWIKQGQIGLHDRHLKGEFKSLSPFTDENGIIRVGGRLKEAVISFESKHPVLLPNDHRISLLITRHYHNQGHLGIAATVAKIRRKYWILKVHKLSKTVKFRCVTCREFEHRTESQFMTDLPKFRLAPFTPPFYNTAVDYFGPYSVKFGRNKTTKHYGVLFTCLNTRSVHLELAVDYSTQAFLQVLRRFFSIRGTPTLMISDNGSQLVGAEKELRDMIKGIDTETLKDFCSFNRMKWRFSTPAAPHQNGCAESMVKVCKTALRKSIGKQLLTPFELYTYLLECANLVNQRPIGRIPNDPNDGSYLCPNDILLGRASSHVAQGPFRDTRNPRKRVEFVQKLVDSFWKQWSRDVLPLLVPRKKWNTQKRNVCVNDIVIVNNQNSVRGKWTIGRVIEVYPGADNCVRNVKVKCQDSEYTRSITKIAVLLPANGYEFDEE